MLKKGDKVPNVTLQGDDGRKVSLADVGKGRAVVYFYPRDDTPGCTREAQGFSAAKSKFAALGVAVYGVSKDSVASHCKFRDKYALGIPLLSDPSLAAHEAFGAFGEKTMYGKKVQGVIRSTFVIEAGKVSHVFAAVKVDGHVEKVLELLGDGSQPTTAAKPKPKATAASRGAPPKKSVSKKTAAKKTSKK